MKNEANPAYKADILVVDDTHDNLRLLSQVLIEHGYYVRAASDGKRALSAIQDQLPDLILLDIMMPGMDGYAICEALKADEQTRNIPVIFISALNETVDKVKAFSRGGVDFITKPFQDEEVLARVETHLSLCNMQRQLHAQNVQLQHEIAERKRTEEALRKANASKDIFFSIIAHDLRSPFTTLLGYTKLVLQRLDNISKEKTREYVTHIKTSTESVYTLLENLLTWSRMQRDVMEYLPERFPLSWMVRRIVHIFISTAQKKQITLYNRVPDEISVYADPNMIHTVIRNLISNALKFTDAGGTIEISAKDHAETVEIYVSDTGVGIPVNALSKLFRIENKLRTTGTAGEQGTGLGLSLCYDLVEKNGGTLEVDSEIDKGSIFRFSLSSSAFSQEISSQSMADLSSEPPNAEHIPHNVQMTDVNTLVPAIAALPESLRTELQDAAKTSDVYRVEAIMGRIRGCDVSLANSLDLLVKDFRYDEILALIQQTGKGENI